MEPSKDSSTIAARIKKEFPALGESMERWESRLPFEFSEPKSAGQIEDLESDLDVPLPESYKRFLRLTSEMQAYDGAVRIGHFHFYHDRGPGKGMLCFGDFFMMADGDQVLLDTTRDPVEGEYAVMYYDHEVRPPCVTKLADSFPQFLGEFMDYEGWGEYEELEDFKPGLSNKSWLWRVWSGFSSLLCLAMLAGCLFAFSRGFTWHWKSVFTIVTMPAILAWLTLFFGVPAIMGIELQELYERWKYRKHRHRS